MMMTIMYNDPVLLGVRRIQEEHMAKLERQIALVTGASSGIGEAAAERLAKAGYTVYGTSRRGATAGTRSFHMLPLDVTSDASVEAAVGEVLQREPHRPPRQQRPALVSPPTRSSELRSIFETNFFGSSG
jgi:NAD(P)-dependent dehydrogenase (short-subunit alcohol dehydrogenase family)